MAGLMRRIFSRETVEQAKQMAHKAAPLPELISRQSGGSPQWNDWSTEQAFREGYQQSTWLYDAIELRRKAVASIPWYVETRNRDGDWERAPDHPLQQLIDAPNPDFTSRQLIGRLVQWLDLGGDAYWIKTRAGRGNLPVELWPVMPDAMTPRVGNDRARLITGYRYDYNNVKQNLPREDVVHFAYPSPGSFYSGVSPLQAAGMAVDIDTEAQGFQKVSLQNRGVPDGVFILRGDAITPEQYQQAREQVAEQYQGHNAHRAPWVVAQAEWQQMSLSPVDLDYINSRKESRVEILSALGVPPPMVGVYDDATLANIETARRIFWQDTIVPLLEELRDAMQSALVPEFGPPTDLRIVYDTSGVEALKRNFREQVETAQKLWAMGVPLNDINQRLELGFDDIPGGDVGYVSASLVPATTSADDDGGGDSEPADEGQTLSESQVQTILTMIGQIARGELPRTSAVELISGAFGLDEADAEAIVGDVVEGSAVDDSDTQGDDGGSDEQRAYSVDEIKTSARERMRARGVGTPEDLARVTYGV